MFHRQLPIQLRNGMLSLRLQTIFRWSGKGRRLTAMILSFYRSIGFCTGYFTSLRGLSWSSQGVWSFNWGFPVINRFWTQFNDLLTLKSSDLVFCLMQFDYCTGRFEIENLDLSRGQYHSNLLIDFYCNWSIDRSLVSNTLSNTFNSVHLVKGVPY